MLALEVTRVNVISSIEAREADSEKFIRTQKRFADLVLSLKPRWVGGLVTQY